MKRSTDKLLRTRKLVVRREHITMLTPPQLRNVVGMDEAGSHWPPCNVSDVNACVPEA
jgi:hypothetical protein